ncbi:flagellar biosynthesis regulator FlaF [Acetobacter sp. TBRC 12305]|uniref:Uncharacterized protein n=1 Tax=Acetobacter garciniae TaxID=2817435 RepID=A0A939HPC8_9PROT|nr:flagellar biosynthesis regulator FlaF [Acetobacter garciniae]MBO1324781.1 hypothetical protein [Acetobacter garciniae]MBX0344472.1 flagellar biosynthesis regulator FlaF [Acetobacter garciniae]
MMIHPAMKAYQNVAESSLSDRETDALCFRLLIEDLQAAAASSDTTFRQHILAKHQRLWSGIIKVNSLDVGVTPAEDRELFIRLAAQAHQYGIMAILKPELSLAPLIEIATNVLEGLETNPADPLTTPDSDPYAMF